MEFQVKPGPVAGLDVEVIVAALFCGEGLPKELKELDAALAGRLGRAIEKGDIKGDAYETTVFFTGAPLKASHVVVVGLGKSADFDRFVFSRAAAVAGKKLKALKARSAAAIMSGKRLHGLDLEERVRFLVQGVAMGPYDPGLYKKKDEVPPELEALVFAPIARTESRAVLQAAREGLIVGESVNFCRNLVNEPANVLTPKEFAKRAQEAAKATGLECDVLEQKQIASLNMNAFLSVSNGSAQPPRLVILRYNGARKGPTLGLVGKGVTFDTGGISIKPAASMEEMKGDMAGAASVVAATLAAARLKLPVNILAMTPLTENMPSGASTRPGDIVRARNGKTVEIINTDAEGRLILSDVLNYMSEMDVDRIIDVATLTGGMVVALGLTASGFMSNNDALSKDILQAAERAAERFWRMPLFPEYKDLIKSPFADMKNVGGRWASPVTGGMFLQEFIGAQPWAHLDIAGPSFIADGNAWRPAGASGEPVRTLIEVARGMAAAKGR